MFYFNLNVHSSVACVVALGPSFPSCAPAVAQLGAGEHPAKTVPPNLLLTLSSDTTFNAACLTAAAKGTAPFVSAFMYCMDITIPGTDDAFQPSPCAGCAAQFGVTDPGSSAKDTSAGAAPNNAPRA